MILNNKVQAYHYLTPQIILISYFRRNALANFVKVAKPVQTDSQTVKNGYGACGVSGCQCTEFYQVGSSQNCDTCGHSYNQHW
jgi:hypothetical protein